MTSKEIIVHVDKKGLEAIFETNDSSNSLFFYDLETQPKLSLALFINNKFARQPLQYTHTFFYNHHPKWILNGQKLLLTHKRNEIK